MPAGELQTEGDPDRTPHCTDPTLRKSLRSAGIASTYPVVVRALFRSTRPESHLSTWSSPVQLAIIPVYPRRHVGASQQLTFPLSHRPHPRGHDTNRSRRRRRRRRRRRKRRGPKPLPPLPSISRLSGTHSRHLHLHLHRSDRYLLPPLPVATLVRVNRTYRPSPPGFLPPAIPPTVVHSSAANGTCAYPEARDGTPLVPQHLHSGSRASLRPLYRHGASMPRQSAAGYPTVFSRAPGLELQRPHHELPDKQQRNITAATLNSTPPTT